MTAQGVFARALSGRTGPRSPIALIALVATIGALTIGGTAPVVATEPGATEPGVTGPVAQAAGGVSVFPPSGVLTVDGRGYGHGRGMSQWGAYGAANQGLTHAKILAHYYPGTAVETTANSWLRVWVSRDDDNTTQVVPAPGLQVVASSATLTLPATLDGATVAAWRAVRGSSGVTIQGLIGRTWRSIQVGGQSQHAGPALFTNASGRVRVALGSTYREYRGSVRAVPVGADSTLRTVVVTPVESYLRSVVPSEMPASWPVQALRSQSVAARTYALWYGPHRGKSWYDACDTTTCQVFNGVADYTSAGALIRTYEHSRTDDAVAATSGQIVTYRGAPALTEFSAANGGWTAKGDVPYMPAVADPYDGVVKSTAHAWTIGLSAQDVARKYPSIGVPRSIGTVSRTGNGTWNGRIERLVLNGSRDSITVSGGAFSSAMGLKSSWWQPRAVCSTGDGPDKDFTGDGHPDVVSRRDDTLWINPGDGAGGFLDPVRVGTGWAGLRSLTTIGDLDKDGHTDLLAVRADGTLWRYRGNGKGGVSAGEQIGHGWRSITTLVGVGDLDGDRIDDLVARRSDGTLWLYAGSGRGWFQPRRPLGTGWSAVLSMVGSGDFDGDCRVDMIAQNPDGRLWLYPANGRGWFGTRKPIGTGWAGIIHVAGPGDWDGDGLRDVLATYPDGTMRLFPGNGRGWFDPLEIINSGWEGLTALT